MMTLRLVLPGLVAAALFVPSQAAAYSRPLSEEVAQAIAPVAQTDAPPPAPAEPAAAAPAAEPAATATAAPNVAPAPTEAKKLPTGSMTAEELEEQSGFGAGVDLDHTMSTSTFMTSDTCQNCAFVGGSLGVGGRYTGKLAGVKLSVSARWGVSLEYTKPDNDTGRRFSHSDLRLGVSAPSILKIPVVDISITPSIGIGVPLTAESWNAGLILGSSAGLGLSRGWKYVSVSLSGSVSHGFYAATANYGIQRADYNIKDTDGRNTFLCRTGESICGINGMNPALGLGGNLSINIRPIDALSFGITYGLGHTWKYAVTDTRDQYTAQTLDSNGNPAAHVGAGQGDRMSANISASYSFNDHIAATLYLQNSQSPRMIDSTGTWAFRFPFADFATPASGTTALGLTFSGSI